MLSTIKFFILFHLNASTLFKTIHLSKTLEAIEIPKVTSPAPSVLANVTALQRNMLPPINARIGVTVPNAPVWATPIWWIAVQ